MERRKKRNGREATSQRNIRPSTKKVLTVRNPASCGSRRRRKKYSDYYLPQIDEAAGQTRDKLTAQLAKRGMLELTVGANTLADLENRRLTSELVSAMKQSTSPAAIRDKVTSSCNSLYDYARSAARSSNEMNEDPKT